MYQIRYMETQPNPARFNAMAKVKLAIYVAISLYASYTIVFGTTFFNEFERMMIFGGIMTAVILGLFFYLGHQMNKHPKKLLN